MSSQRTQKSTLVGALAVLVLVLTGFTAPAQAATSRTLSLKASPVTGFVGAKVTFSGKVTRSPKGSTVKIQRKSGTSWVAAGSTRTTTTAGAYAVKVTLPSVAAAYTYRALAPKTSKRARAYSRTVSVTALRHTSATISASASTIGTGGASTLSGHVSPFVTGGAVTVQRLSGGTWITDSTTTLSSSGTYAHDVHPTTTTTYRVAVPRTGLNGATQSAATTVTVTQADAPVITTTSLPDGDKSVAYTAALSRTGGAGTWTITAGALPAGIVLNASTGALSGTPSAGGTATFTVRFTETGTGLSASKALSITVTPLPTVSTDSLPDATRGVPYSVTLTHTGHPGTWALATSPEGYDGLPTGLSLDGATGTISGTVTGASGTYGIYPVFTETSTGRQAFKALALTVTGQNVAVTTTSVPDGTTGTAYSQQLTKTGGAGTWTLKSGTLPAGITFSAAGLLSGTPSATGDYGFTVTFTETATGVSDNQPLLLHVSAPGAPVINTTSLPDATVGVPYTATLSAVGTGTWSVVYNVPPPGITLNSATGVLSGTPTTDADYVFIVKFTTATGSNTKALAIHVNPAG